MPLYVIPQSPQNPLGAFPKQSKMATENISYWRLAIFGLYEMYWCIWNAYTLVQYLFRANHGERNPMEYLFLQI